ncbi:MAG: arabinan endo-1,5-alpha-L-arabinosidase [Verrucomicrobiota bacterium]|jgi:arabinan endo-1,5-alpha-L-arabinosidase
MTSPSQKLAVVVLSLACCGVAFGAETNTATNTAVLLLGRRDVSVHDPSTIVRCKDEYWVFATGRGLVSRHSTNLTHWTLGPRVFTNAPSWTTNAVPGNRGDFWAPDVIHLGNRYLLYYAVSTWGKNTSAIGLATNRTLDPADPDYAWADQGPVIQTTATSDCNAIDPAITLDTGGKLWLAFGSFWTGIKLVELDPTTGKRRATNSPIYSLAHHDMIEASYIYWRDGYYYLFVNWGQCCRGVKSTYNIRVGRCKKITGPYLDKEGVDLLLDGGSLVLGSTGPFIGPGHAGIISAGGQDWFSCHFYDGTREGNPTLALLPLQWDAAGWPVVGAPH